jgi:hypothetical protein
MNGLGIMAKGVVGCVGDLQSPEGKCCATSDWNNGTYGSVKGLESLRHANEQRIRHAMHALLHPRGDDPTGLQQIAYDIGANRVAGGFEAWLHRSWANFEALYPMSRWHKVSDGVDTGVCGTKSVWRASPVAQGADWFDAAQDVTQNEPGGLQSWMPKADAVVAAVPGGAAPNLYTVMPRTHQGDMVGRSNRTLVTLQNGKVAPGPWLLDFMKTFAPVSGTLPIISHRPGVKAGVGPAGVTISKSVVLGLRPSTQERVMRAEPPPAVSFEEEDKPFPWLLLGGAVAVGLGIFVAGPWVLSRMG